MWFVSVYSILIFGLWNMYIIIEKKLMHAWKVRIDWSTYKLQSSLVGFVVFGGKTSFGFLHQWSDIYHFFLSSNAYEERLDWCIFVRLLIFLFPSWNFFHEIVIYGFFPNAEKRGGKMIDKKCKVIYPKYSKHWLSTVERTIDCVCSKILNQYFSFSWCTG